MKKRNILHCLLLALGLLLCVTAANGQNAVKGMRAPRLNNSDRNSISAIDATAAKGQVIYNSENDCMEYWNGTRWVSLCTGQAHITFTPALPAMPLPASDGSYGPFTPADEPNCTSQNPAYGFMVMTGGDWLQVDVEDESTGKFRVSLAENQTAIARNAIVRVTNNCTQEYKEFLWTQAGDASGCGVTTATVPAILSENGASVCNSDLSSGAAYLYLSGRPATGNFIWTLNGQEVGTGNSYIAEQGGTYVVYGDKIGCTTPAPQSIVVSSGTGTPAPAPVQIIAGLNNGYVCSSGGETTLFASGSGNIIWYRNGVRQASKTGNTITAGVGDWFAVVESGSCSSIPSNKVTVSLHPSAGSSGISPISFTINGTAPSGNAIDLCSGGALLLELAYPHPQAGVTYTWYAGDKNNGTTLGIGESVSTTVATLGAAPMIQVVGERANSCAQAQYTSFSISAIKNPPPRPFVTSNTENVICGSATQLTASSAGATSYAWFKDGVELPQTGATIPVSLQGSYAAYAKNAAGCVSLVSVAYNINASSGFASGLSIMGNQNPDVNTVENYTAVMNNATVGSNYTWSVPAPHILENGQGTSTIVVRLGSSTAPFNLSVSANNACGTAMPNPAVQTIAPKSSCTISIISHIPSTRSISVPAGTNPGLSIVANSSAPTINYQWYRNTTASTVGATPVSSGSASLTGQTALTSGTYYYYCVATAVCGANPTAQSQFFTVTVTLDPSTLPAGVGSLAGRTCFDVAQNTCENLPANVRSQTNFALRTPQTTASTAPYSGVQTYTFTSRAANVSNVRYELVRTAGNLTASQLIDPATPLSGTLQPGALANGSSVNLEIKYMNNLNTALAGTSRGDGAKIALYIIYFNGTQDVQIKTVISIQDCACCGAFTAAGVFKVFMCHNLGANESLDPFLTGQAGLHGAKYKWGTGVVALPMAQDQSTPGGISGWGSIGGTPPNTALDWDMNTANPCPVGYRVPTEAEFAGMISNNTWTAKLAPGGSWVAGNSNYSSGKMVGSALFLPAAGNRAYTNGALSGRGNKGFYWTASPASTVLSARLEFSNTVAENVTGGSSRNKSFGMSIRCIEQ